MRKCSVFLAGVALAAIGGCSPQMEPPSSQDEALSGAGFAAVAGEVGGWDLTGPYEVVADWPRPLSDLPGHEDWTWGAVQGVFAESPDRVFVLQRGELPVLTGGGRGRGGQRNASGASPPGAGAPGADPADPAQAWRGTLGVDARWEHCILVMNAEGAIVEAWTQWDSMLRRPHSVYINPYDPDKHVWVVDDHNHAIFKFSNDGEELVQTIGTVGEVGADETHFNRPTFLAWLPDSTMFVADGYNGTRVAKFDAEGNFLLDWGEEGNSPGRNAPPETRPGYFNGVHGIAVDPATRRVFVSDRQNLRIQVFDENGTYLHEWPAAANGSVQFLYIGADGYVWGVDNPTARIVKWDQEGHLQYSWGSLGPWPGGFSNMHGMSVDQEGNVYVVEVGGGRVQKFRPRDGANPDFLVSKPVYAAWN